MFPDSLPLEASRRHRTSGSTANEMSATTAPADQTDESPPPPPPVPEPQRALPTPFLTKTYQMVEDPAVNDVISWNEDGSTFVVWRPADFALDLLPKYFKHNNFSSFVRQLNTYGFRKIVPDRWEFSNEFFRRGEKRMLCDIHRKKFCLPAVAVAVAVPLPVPTPSALPAYRSGSSTNSGEFQLEQVSLSSSLPEVTAGSAAAPPGSTVDLVDENERLRKENRKLASELSEMKNICNSIFVLMSKYATGQGCGQPPLEALELMPVSRILEEAEEICVKSDEPMPSLTVATGSSSWYYEASPMLFGVSIGEKRYREENDGEEEQTATTNPPEVKLESEPEPEPEPFHLVETEAAAAAVEEEQQPWVVYYPRPQRACNGNGREFMELDGEHVS